jgi:pimeloyl-ACP methyl ester carboxylesterase
LRRRTLLAGGALGAVLNATHSGARAASSRPVFVLVHGAWHGGWCWRRVADRLQAAGARVLTPTLTGCGERAHLMAPEVGLETHIQDVVAVIEAEELTDVHLCGHSYGGMVITGVCDRLKDRIASVLYLDAAVPTDGQTMITQSPGITSEAATATEAGLRALAPDGVAMQVFPDVTIFGVAAGGEDEAWLKRRLTPHPLKTWLDPIRLTNGGSDGLRRAYVHCVDPVLPMASFPAHYARLRADQSWSVSTLATGHDAMITAPAAVADLLLSQTVRG